MLGFPPEAENFAEDISEFRRWSGTSGSEKLFPAKPRYIAKIDCLMSKSTYSGRMLRKITFLAITPCLLC